jgi:hypothetical protein
VKTSATLFGLVAAVASLTVSPAHAVDDKTFGCMTMEYWLAKSSYVEKDIYEEISKSCSLTDEQFLEVSEFVDTVQAATDGGGKEFFLAVYGPDKTKIFEEISRETIRVVDTIDAHLIKTMPIP